MKINPFLEFVQNTAQNLDFGKSIPLGQAEFPDHPPLDSRAPVGMIFSPHPDDECISGGLPLRLFREAGFRIINIPVTLGSDLLRRPARLIELENACRYLGFDVHFAAENGFENISPDSREGDALNWNFAVEKTAELIERFNPQVVFFPHRSDRHPAHCGTNLLVSDALQKMPGDFSCITVENEFWQAMESPNCLIELSDLIVGDLIAALTFHIGEVQRNPYHLSFPSWLINNVRRGSEIVGTAGAKSQNFTFGVLHRISEFKSGELKPVSEEGEFISNNDPLTRFR